MKTIELDSDQHDLVAALAAGTVAALVSGMSATKKKKFGQPSSFNDLKHFYEETERRNRELVADDLNQKRGAKQMILRNAIGDDLQAEYYSGERANVMQVKAPCVVLLCNPGQYESAGFATEEEAAECLRRVLKVAGVSEPMTDGIYDISPKTGNGYVHVYAERVERDEEGQPLALNPFAQA